MMYFLKEILLLMMPTFHLPWTVRALNSKSSSSILLLSAEHFGRTLARKGHPNVDPTNEANGETWRRRAQSRRGLYT